MDKDKHEWKHNGRDCFAAREGSRAVLAVPTIGDRREEIAAAEILRLAQEKDDLADRATAVEARLVTERLTRAKVEEERDGLKMTVEEGQEIGGELTAALAVLAGESLIPCGVGEHGDQKCPGHFGLAAQEAVRGALNAWRALQEGNRQAVERIALLEAANLRLMGEVSELTNLKSLHRACFKPLEAQQRDGENLEDTLARIIRERDGYLKGRESALSEARKAGAAADAALRGRDSWRSFAQKMHLERDAAQRENRSKCSELAEMAGEIRELRAVVDAAAAFVKEGSAAALDELDKRRAALEGSKSDEDAGYVVWHRLDGDHVRLLPIPATMEARRPVLKVAVFDDGDRVALLHQAAGSAAAKLLALLDSEEPPEGFAKAIPFTGFSACAWRWLREQVHHTGAPGKSDDTRASLGEPGPPAKRS
jgi:hypothetical protein